MRTASRAMRQIDLREYEKSGPLTLTVAERDALASSDANLTITPAVREDSRYHVTPASTVGAIEIGDLSVLIRPKIGIPNLLSLACFAMGAFRHLDRRLFDFEEDVETLPDTLAIALAAAARRAFSRGLLHGYQTEEEALQTVRGRIRFDDQIRRRFGIALPIEVRYDEFTDDILENRLVKSAIARLGGMRLRSQKARSQLGSIAAMLENISLVSFGPRELPPVPINQLNEHYREVVMLSLLVLRHRKFESRRGKVRASGFLMDMNKVFQDFVTVALREELGVSERVFCSDNQLKGKRRIHLDEKRNVRLEPDLTWWHGQECLYVGDVKYKANERAPPNADLYQLLAYATALDLPGGMLIYAKGEADPVTREVRHIRKKLEIAALDLSGGLDEVLNRVKDIAVRVRAMCDATQRQRAAS